jgi:hypothetical protein
MIAWEVVGSLGAVNDGAAGLWRLAWQGDKEYGIFLGL